MVDRYGAAMFRVACRLLGSRHDAEDAVQEVFVAMARHPERLASVANMRAYLFVSLRHAAERIGRTQRRHPAGGFEESYGPVGDDRAGRAVDDSETAERLWALAQRLPAQQREVLALKIQGELSFREIGEILGIGVNTAASRYRYALEKLRHMAEEHDESR
ncbi:MAG: sigma-70 family RNA polymerase sigma factor [Phycisphaerae bacterium]|nr:sigma-70 family RNA polymerase sigma factor [Phycisphaerae bacterium]